MVRLERCGSSNVAWYSETDISVVNYKTSPVIAAVLCSASGV